MYVRLAFSVAAHLEPEILLVDEVLAVGDAEFQARCLGRMEDFGANGRTVLFVSHNMQAIAQLCDRAILLDQRPRRAGRSERRGRRALPADVGRRRLEPHVGRPRQRARRRSRAAPLGEDRRPRRRNRRLRRRPRSGRGRDRVPRAPRRALPSLPKLKLVAEGRIAFNAMDVDPRWHEPSPPGEYVATAWIPGNYLNEGLMSVDAAVCSIRSPKLHHHVSVARGGVVPRPGSGRGRLGARHVHGSVARGRASAARVVERSASARRARTASVRRGRRAIR